MELHHHNLPSYAALLIAISGPALLIAGEPPPRPAGQATASAVQSEVTDRELVNKLGHPAYKVRCEAAKLLQRRGIAAEQALRAGLNLANPLEIRMQCERLLSSITVSGIESRLQALIGGDDKRAGEFPGWQQFRDTAGASKLSRRVYAEMYRSEQSFLELIPPGTLSAAQRRKFFVERLEQIRREIYSPGADRLKWKTITAILLVGTSAGADVSHEQINRFEVLLGSPATRALFENDERSGPMKKVLSAWLRKIRESKSPYTAMTIALNYKLPDGVKFARDYVTRRGSSSLISGAILAIAANRDRADLPLLEKQLSNATICYSGQSDGKSREAQARDVALAAIIHLYGRDPKNFGFPEVSRNPDRVFDLHTLAFSSDAQRQAAHDAWTNRDKSRDATATGP